MAGGALQAAVAQGLAAHPPTLVSAPPPPSLAPRVATAPSGPAVTLGGPAVRVPSPVPPPSAAPSGPVRVVATAGIVAPSAVGQGPVPAAADQPAYGSTLHDLFARGPLSVEQAIARIGLVAETVALQRKGSHGALTPWHVRFDSKDATGRPKIAPPDAVRDIAQLAPYRAPELEKNEPGATTTASAEVYALGCMLFEAIAGRAPFVGTVQEQAKRHATAAAPAVRMVRRDCELPPALEMEIQRALKKRPGDRHADATVLANAMRAANREDDRSTMALNITDANALKEMMAAATAGKNPAVAATRGGAAGGIAVTGPASANSGSQGVARPGGPAITAIDGLPVPSAATSGAPPAAKKGNPMLLVSLVAIVALGGILAFVLLGKSPPPPQPAPVAAVAPRPDAPDVVVAPDVQPDLPPDVQPDVQPDIVVETAPEPDVEVAPVIKPKGGHVTKVGPKPPGETPKEEKKEEKKNPGNGPAVF